MVSFLYFVSLEKRTESGFYWGQKQQLGAKKGCKGLFLWQRRRVSHQALIDRIKILDSRNSFLSTREDQLESERGDGALALWSNSPSKLIYRPATLPPNRTDMVCFLSECVSCQGNPGGSRKSRKGVLDTILHLNWFPRHWPLSAMIRLQILNLQKYATHNMTHIWFKILVFLHFLYSGIFLHFKNLAQNASGYGIHIFRPGIYLISPQIPYIGATMLRQHINSLYNLFHHKQFKLMPLLRFFQEGITPEKIQKKHIRALFHLRHYRV